MAMQEIGLDIRDAAIKAKEAGKRGLEAVAGAPQAGMETIKGGLNAYKEGVHNLAQGLRGIPAPAAPIVAGQQANATAGQQQMPAPQAAKPAAPQVEKPTVDLGIPKTQGANNVYDNERAQGLASRVNTVSYAPYLKEAAAIDAKKAAEDAVNPLEEGMKYQQAQQAQNLATAKAVYDAALAENPNVPRIAMMKYQEALQAGGQNNMAGLNVGIAEKSAGEQAATERTGLQEAGQNQRSAAQLAQAGEQHAGLLGLRSAELEQQRRAWENQLQGTGRKVIKEDPMTGEKIVSEEMQSNREIAQKAEQNAARKGLVSNRTEKAKAEYDSIHGKGSADKFLNFYDERVKAQQ